MTFEDSVMFFYFASRQLLILFYSSMLFFIISGPGASLGGSYTLPSALMAKKLDTPKTVAMG